MESIKLKIADPEAFKISENEKSLAYFSKLPSSYIGVESIGELRAASARHGGKNVRICLHSGPESSFHDMVVLERLHSFSLPHQHPRKGESIHLIEGQLAVFLFHESGETREVFELSPDGNILAHIAARTYHVYLPLTNPVVFRETKSGPFSASEDNLTAPWAPEASDEKSIASYRAELLAGLDRL